MQSTIIQFKKDEYGNVTASVGVNPIGRVIQSLPGNFSDPHEAVSWEVRINGEWEDYDGPCNEGNAALCRKLADAYIFVERLMQ